MPESVPRQTFTATVSDVYSDVVRQGGRNRAATTTVFRLEDDRLAYWRRVDGASWMSTFLVRGDRVRLSGEFTPSMDLHNGPHASDSLVVRRPRITFLELR